MFEIRFSNKSEKNIKQCENKIKKRFKHLFEKLKTNPIPIQKYDLKKIAGREDIYRIRLSSYRVVYCVYWKQRLIRVLKIERRKDRTYKI